MLAPSRFCITWCILLSALLIILRFTLLRPITIWWKPELVKTHKQTLIDFTQKKSILNENGELSESGYSLQGPETYRHYMNFDKIPALKWDYDYLNKILYKQYYNLISTYDMNSGFISEIGLINVGYRTVLQFDYYNFKSYQRHKFAIPQSGWLSDTNSFIRFGLDYSVRTSELYLSVFDHVGKSDSGGVEIERKVH